MPIEIDNEGHLVELVRLNEIWIREHFAVEDADRKLASDPYEVIRDGGHVLSLVDNGRVVGVCALFKRPHDQYELARMAVHPTERRKGYGDALIRAAMELAKNNGGTRVYLLSNTLLEAAIALYRKHGFRTVSEGRHPIYARCNIVMDREL